MFLRRLMKLLIAGAGGHGRVVADIALISGICSDVAFLDDRFPSLALPEGWPVIGKLAALAQCRADFQVFAVAFGDAQLRIATLKCALEAGFECPCIAHSSAVISQHAVVGKGTIVAANAVINTGAVIGAACIVNTAATVDHDCRLGDGVHVSPGANLAGGVAIGAETWVGIGAVVKQGVKIGANVIVGAGAVVINDIPDGVTVVGNPARPLAT